jgi:glycosyltransferase involved in cell wall biosynthesis
MKILIFIITYKASFRVNKIMKEIPFDYLKKFNYKILISDDCSNDDTKDYIDQIKKNNKKNIVTNFNSTNLGYGGNIKKCIKYAYKNKFDIAAMIHGDNQYSAKYLKEMIVLLTKNDCAAVSGSRMMKKKLARKGGMPFYKFIGNILLTKYFNFLQNTSFTDCHTGYWVYNLRKIKKKWIEKLDNGFLFDLDVRLKLVQKKLTVKEVSILTRYGTERSSMHITYATRFFVRTFVNKVLFFFK